QLALQIPELDLAQLRVAPELRHFQRRRVGGDVEQRLAPLDEVADRGKALSHDAGEDGLDADLDPGLDGADGEGLVNQGATDHRHRLGTVGLLAAELSGGGHGPQAEHDEHGDDDDGAALHLRAAPSRRIGWDALSRQYVAWRRLFPARDAPPCVIEMPRARIGRRSADHDSSCWALNPDKESVCVTIHHAWRRSRWSPQRSPVPTAHRAPRPTLLPASRPSSPRRPAPSSWHAPSRSRSATPRSAPTSRTSSTAPHSGSTRCRSSAS